MEKAMSKAPKGPGTSSTAFSTDSWADIGTESGSIPVGAGLEDLETVPVGASDQNEAARYIPLEGGETNANDVSAAKSDTQQHIQSEQHIDHERIAQGTIVQTQTEQDDFEGLEDDHADELSPQALTAIEQQYRALSDDIPDRIHILGTGSIGKLVAHSLRNLPNPPKVTLLLHRFRLLKAWNEGSKAITVNRYGKNIRATGYDVEIRAQTRVKHGVVVAAKNEHLFAVQAPHEAAAQLLYDKDAYRYQLGPKKANSFLPSSNEVIDHLIITTKTAFTVSAVLSIIHRIRPWTTICILQNGMGIIDKLNEKVFKNEERRPTFIQGVITHGANVPPEMARKDPFYVVHAGQGSIALGLLAKHSTDGDKYPERSRWLLRQLTRAPELVAVVHSENELFQLQLEKLAVNCIINPLTALMDMRNGNINNNFHFKRLIRLMLAEISLVIRNLPELKGLPNVTGRFHPNRLEALVYQVAEGTAQNVSSMLADVRSGNRTEIEFINGYIIRRGEELGIKCVVNYGIMHAVIGKAALSRREVFDEGDTQENHDLNRGH